MQQWVVRAKDSDRKALCRTDGWQRTTGDFGGRSIKVGRLRLSSSRLAHDRGL
jgi:hypothetical protein